VGIIEELADRNSDRKLPFLISGAKKLTFDEITKIPPAELADVKPGDVVAIVGDFEPQSIRTFLELIDRRVVIVPLTTETRPHHDYYFDAAGVDVVIKGRNVRRIRRTRMEHDLLEVLRKRKHPGLVLFSSGTTGRPKAILHDMETFLVRFRTPRPTLRTINFLLFDHIGGINTLLHTLYNSGTIVVPRERNPLSVLEDIRDFDVELLPTTPTFLRMLLLSGLIPKAVSPSLKLVTYGTERMDQGTLDQLCSLLPNVDFRQTFGMSELGILRVKSQARDSLWMKIGGEGVEVRVVDGVLQINAENRMLGYLNAPSPFDEEGWYDSKDVVEQDGEYLRIVGRTSEVISVGGIKVLPSEIERAALLHGDVVHAQAKGLENPIIGQHIELLCQPREGSSLSRSDLLKHLKNHLAESILPHRIRIGKVEISHRFKRS